MRKDRLFSHMLQCSCFRICAYCCWFLCCCRRSALDPWTRPRCGRWISIAGLVGKQEHVTLFQCLTKPITISADRAPCRLMPEQNCQVQPQHPYSVSSSTTAFMALWLSDPIASHLPCTIARAIPSCHTATFTIKGCQVAELVAF
jgi:hypothetical protein